MKFIDESLKFFGEWFSLFPSRKNNQGKWMYWCICSCGRFEDVYVGDLRMGKSTRCKHCTKNSLTHGEAHKKGTPYETWAGIKARTSNPRHSSFKSYGGRGIKLCQDWQEYISFRDWAIANGWKEGLTIHRKNNNGDYYPENCVWLSLAENIRMRYRPMEAQ